MPNPPKSPDEIDVDSLSQAPPREVDPESLAEDSPDEIGAVIEQTRDSAEAHRLDPMAQIKNLLEEDDPNLVVQGAALLGALPSDSLATIDKLTLQVPLSNLQAAGDRLALVRCLNIGVHSMEADFTAQDAQVLLHFSGLQKLDVFHPIESGALHALVPRMNFPDVRELLILLRNSSDVDALAPLFPNLSFLTCYHVGPDETVPSALAPLARLPLEALALSPYDLPPSNQTAFYASLVDFSALRRLFLDSDDSYFDPNALPSLPGLQYLCFSNSFAFRDLDHVLEVLRRVFADASSHPVTVWFHDCRFGDEELAWEQIHPLNQKRFLHALSRALPGVNFVANKRYYSADPSEEGLLSRDRYEEFYYEELYHAWKRGVHPSQAFDDVTEPYVLFDGGP